MSSDNKEDGWIGCDLDGTLAEHYPKPDFDPMEIGPPVPLMVNTIKRHLEDGYEVRILTARVAASHQDRDIEAVREAIADWTEKHLGQRLQVTHEKDKRMLFAYDDRIRQVIPNTGITMGQLVAALRRMLERGESNPEYGAEVEDYLAEEE